MAIHSMPHSLQAIARQWEFRSSVVGLALNGRGDFVGLALGNGQLHLLEASDLLTDQEEEPQSHWVHEGGLLSFCPDADGVGFLSGGRDGRLCLTEPAIATPTCIIETGGAITGVAARAEALRVIACKDQLTFLSETGDVDGDPVLLPAVAVAMAFSPNDPVLAVGTPLGLALVSMVSRKVSFVARNPIVSLFWAEDGKKVATGSTEPSFSFGDVGSAVPQLTGKSQKEPRSMAVTVGTEFLVVSGDERILLYPMKEGVKPLTLGAEKSGIVMQVAPHPVDRMIAAGYDNGMVVLAPLDGRMEIVILPPLAPEGYAIVGLLWNREGNCLFAATENGRLFLFTLDSVQSAVTPTVR